MVIWIEDFSVDEDRMVFEVNVELNFLVNDFFFFKNIDYFSFVRLFCVGGIIVCFMYFSLLWVI